MAKIDETVKVVMLKGERGAGIQKIEKTASSGLVDTYTATFSDGTAAGSFTVTNGAKGDKGDKGDAGITVPMSGLFSLGVDADGNIIASYNDAGTGETPKFEYDRESGNVYYII